MARHAILGRGLVEEHGLGVNNFVQFVTVGAFDVLVSAPQGERGPLVVIEQGGLPFRGVVAVGTGGSVRFGDELLPVDVLVAILADGGGCLEIHIHHVGFEVWRFVAIDTGRRPVCSKQWELGLGMVESGELLPRLGAMACLATSGGTVGADLLHALLELSFVGIVVATGAVQALPVINDVRFGLELRRFLVALGAGDGDMAAGQNKPGLLVLGQGKG